MAYSSHRCVASSADCAKYDKSMQGRSRTPQTTTTGASSQGSEDDVQDYIYGDSGLCPYKLPIRCFSTGVCVGTAQECQLAGSSSLREDLKLSNPLISSKCEIEKPIRCFTGTCVAHPQQCLEDERFTSQESYSRALQEPAPFILLEQSVFSAVYAHEQDVAAEAADFHRACRVVCSDGSCRDEPRSCPPIHGCSSSASLRKQLRCSSGFCSKDAESCYRLEQEIAGRTGGLLTSSQESCQEYDKRARRAKPTRRCEDG